MDIKFCECGSTLRNIIINDVIKHKCSKCKKEYPGDVYSSVLYSESKTSNSNIYEIFSSMINYAVYDISIPIVDFDCPNCKHFIAKELRLGTDEKMIRVCIKCHKVYDNEGNANETNVIIGNDDSNL